MTDYTNLSMEFLLNGKLIPWMGDLMIDEDLLTSRKLQKNSENNNMFNYLNLRFVVRTRNC